MLWRRLCDYPDLLQTIPKLCPEIWSCTAPEMTRLLGIGQYAPGAKRHWCCGIAKHMAPPAAFRRQLHSTANGNWAP